MTRRRVLLAAGALLAVLVVLLAVAVIVGLSLAEQVRGTSMSPTLHDGDRVVVTPSTGGSAHRFEVVVADDPTRAGTKIVKRVVGVPGDAVAIRGTMVFVRPGNRGGWLRVVEPVATAQWRLPTPCCSARGARAGRAEAQIVPPEHYFVLGDNPDSSIDSRTFGWLPGSSIDGRLGLRLWPPSDFGGIGNVPHLEPAADPTSS